MNTPLPIPSTHQTLIACLRCAFHDAPAPQALRQTDWARLFKQAQEHGVHTFLYPWLATHFPALFASGSQAAGSAVPHAWRSSFLSAVYQSALRRRQLSELFNRFAQAKLDLIPLKGAWLCENVYADPAQRTMSDLDLLVRQEDLDASHALFLACGYSAGHNTLHNPFSRDQSYRHISYPWPVELHWNFVSKMADEIPAPDIQGIWKSAAPATCYGQPICQLSLEDSVAHMAHHMISHTFALPLRAHLDLALFILKFGDLLSPQRLAAASARWSTGASIPFLLHLASALFDCPLGPKLDDFAGKSDPLRLAQACNALFRLPPARARDGEGTLLRFQAASWPGRIRLIVRRIFMPKEFLVLHYPCARHTYGVPLAWLFRTRDLVRHKSWKLRALSRDGSSDARLLADAQTREALVRWLVTKTEEPV